MGEGLGVWIDPTTGQLLVSESVYTAMGIAAWLAAVVLGMVTAWLALP